MRSIRFPAFCESFHSALWVVSWHFWRTFSSYPCDSCYCLSTFSFHPHGPQVSWKLPLVQSIFCGTFARSMVSYDDSEGFSSFWKSWLLARMELGSFRVRPMRLAREFLLCSTTRLSTRRKSILQFSLKPNRPKLEFIYTFFLRPQQKHPVCLFPGCFSSCMKILSWLVIRSLSL